MPTENLNPYAAPAELSGQPEPKPARIPIGPRRSLALWMLAGTTLAAMLWTYCDEVVWATGIGAWPMLFGCALISIAASFLTRDWIVSPLCCFVGAICGDLVAAIIRSWAYAQLELCVPLAALFSIPALAIAGFLHYRASRLASSDNEQGPELYSAAS